MVLFAVMLTAVGAFWAGLALFRRVLGIPGALRRLFGGLVLAAVTLVGAAFSAFAALVLLLAGSVGLLVLEH